MIELFVALRAEIAKGRTKLTLAVERLSVVEDVEACLFGIRAGVMVQSLATQHTEETRYGRIILPSYCMKRPSTWRRTLTTVSQTFSNLLPSRVCTR